jgi:hypothetical protein
MDKTSYELKGNVVTLFMHFRKPTTSRKADIEEGNFEDVDISMLRLSKEIIDSPELKKIESYDSQTYTYVKRVSMPFLEGMRGFYTLYPSQVEKIHDYLTERSEGRKVLINAFIEEYPRLVLEAKKRLGKMFEPADYPAPEALPDSFGAKWRFVSIDVCPELKDIDEKIWREQSIAMKKDWEDLWFTLRETLRISLKKMLDHFSETLRGEKDGVPKRFKTTTIEKIQEFLSTFATRDITNDADLESVVEATKALLGSFDPEDIRYSSKDSDDVKQTVVDVRQAVASGFEEISSVLDSLLKEKEIRKFKKQRAA